MYRKLVSVLWCGKNFQGQKVQLCVKKKWFLWRNSFSVLCEDGDEWPKLIISVKNKCFRTENEMIIDCWECFRMGVTFWIHSMQVKWQKLRFICEAFFAPENPIEVFASMMIIGGLFRHNLHDTDFPLKKMASLKKNERNGSNLRYQLIFKKTERNF